jgi:alpha-tubulin suppressor-like RCC1 family protein
MKTLRRSRRLPRLVGPATLTLGLVGLIAAAAAAAPAQAQAQVTVTPAVSRVVASWGDNSWGELGDGTMALLRTQYRDIAAGSDVIQVAAGRTHNLAVRSDGTVTAWGLNDHGALGDGTTTDRSTPVQVSGLSGVITQVAAGEAFSLALRSDGTVWAWGRNDRGQLGRGTTSSGELVPARVAVLNRVTKISAGRDFALALRSDGIVFAWGANRFGQVGNGAASFSPVTVPVKVVGLAQVTGISAGSDSALATEASGISAVTSVWAWGNNDDGQLGDGTTAGHATPERVTGLPVYIAGISAGGQYAAVLGTDGSVWGWGTNGLGQLNFAPTVPVTRPVSVIAAGSRITQISAGGGHMLALRSDGTVLGWGFNVRGQLGNGVQTQISGPVQVTNMGGATQVAAGIVSSYAVHTVLVLAGQSS